MDNLHGAGAVYSATAHTFQHLRSLVEHASYNETTGHALRELTGLAASQTGWLAFDASRHDDARQWWHEALQWAHLAEADSVSVVAMAAMAWQAIDRDRPREAIAFAAAAQRSAKSASTPRLTSILLAREAGGHARGKATPQALRLLCTALVISPINRVTTMIQAGLISTDRRTSPAMSAAPRYSSATLRRPRAPRARPSR